ncbi:hypothetical protein [Shewanella sediminis]|uniref:hypothetical protein n=1 Tax=Shewanella sediminis TaxID=271097 RepID=UPI00059D4627|nr:hypothetical protein [Shewanella sediminis]
MSLFIIVFGLLIVIAGTILTISPKVIIDFLESNKEKLWIHILAVVVRVILGICLILQSNISKFPIIVEIFGWLSLTAAILITVIGRSSFQQLMNWVITKVKPYARLGGLVSAGFGVFLIYAFI